MEKIENFASHNMLAENIEKLKALFPTAFSEDKLILRELAALTGDYSLDPEEEFYEMTWAGKSNAKRVTNTPSTGTLRPAKEESKNWDTTENLYIEGDNLEVLKLLQKSYNDRVKMIYIDPPYNTGNQFVYEDKFQDNLKNYLKITGQIDGEGNKITTNTESDGRYHSNWLNMMYPRLKLARNLLTEDGVIFISIDDNEQTNLKKLCDEIFGEENFVANMIWQGGKMNAARLISTSHEYILIYAKSLTYCRTNNIDWREKKKGLDDIYNIVAKLLKDSNNNYEVASKKLKQWYNSANEDSKAHKHYSYIDQNGIYCMDNVSRVGGGKYSVINPINGIEISPPSRGWTYGNEKDFWQAYKDGVIMFRDDDKLPVFKRYLKDNELQLLDTVFYKDRRGAKIRLRNLMGKDVFDFPKDEEVLMNLIDSFNEKEGIILDFFSGSSSTAHAVMALNAEDGGNRKCISVQLPEPTDEKSEAYKAGYKNIADIGKERIRRAGEQIKEEHKDKEGIENLDIGFKVFKLDSSNIVAWDNQLEAFDNQLAFFDETNAEHIKQGRSSEDVLYEILLKYGLDLSVPIEEKQIDGQLIYNIGAGSMYVCLDDEVSISVAKNIGEWAKEYEDLEAAVIFKDSAFKDDASKTNVVQTLKQFGINHVKSI